MSFNNQKPFKEIFEKIEQAEAIFAFVPSLFANIKDDFEKQKNEAVNILNTMSRFNEEFGDMCWTASGVMSLEAAKEALKINDLKGKEDAEEFLENHWNTVFDFWVLRFRSIPFTRSRYRLIELAYDDHKAGRYHASVPIFIAQIDGISHDLKSRGFYSGKNNQPKLHLISDETFVNHSSGLSKVATIMNSGRDKTSRVQLNIPYRNGIMHGRDLGYANKRVSTKLLAILISLSEWVKTAEPIEIEDTNSTIQTGLQTKFTTITGMLQSLNDFMEYEIFDDNEIKPSFCLSPQVYENESNELIEIHEKRALLYGVYRTFIHTNAHSVTVRAIPHIWNQEKNSLTFLNNFKREITIERNQLTTIANSVLKVDSLDELVGEENSGVKFPNSWSDKFNKGYYSDRKPGLDKHFEALTQ